jgi:hypothetical protein
VLVILSAAKDLFRPTRDPSLRSELALSLRHEFDGNIVAMGLALLDMTFRTEKAFKIRMPKDWPQQLGINWGDGGKDATLAQYHAFILPTNP